MPKLADIIRQKYPGQYDDMADDDLEKAVLARYPEYKDLAKPDESLVSKAQEPIATPTPTMQEAQKSLTEEHPVLGSIGQFGTDILTSLSSPVNLGLAALSGGSSVAEKAGFEGLSKALEMPARAASFGMTGKGLYDTATAPTWAGKAGGLVETGAGVLGLRSNLGKLPETPPTSLDLRVAPETTPITSAKPKFRLEPDGQYSWLGDNGQPMMKGSYKQLLEFAQKMAPEGADATKGVSKGIMVQQTPELTKMGVKADKINPINEAANFTKSMMASVDVSAPLRQGIGLIYRPEYWKTFDDMLKSLGSENYFQALQQAITEKPIFQQKLTRAGTPIPKTSFADQAGLSVTKLNEGLSKREELYFSKLAEKFPGVRASERAYYGFLNKLRADTFENMLADLAGVSREADGSFSPQSTAKMTSNLPQAKQLAEYINTATGRGSLGKLEEYAPELNAAFFSPRLIASRLKLGTFLFDPRTYTMMDPAIRKNYIKSLLSVAGFGLTTGALAEMSGAGTVNKDPTNADFGKIKIGDTRIDPWAGHQQYLVAASRFLSGNKTSSVSGQTQELGGRMAPSRMGLIFGVGDKYNPSFMENKFSPLLRFADDMMSGRLGKPSGVGGALSQMTGAPGQVGDVANMFIPMFVNDTVDILRSDPSLAQLVGIPAAALGAGVQTYPSR